MSFDFIDFTDLANIEAHIKPNTKLIFSESPANPTLTLTDLSAVSVSSPWPRPWPWPWPWP